MENIPEFTLTNEPGAPDTKKLVLSASSLKTHKQCGRKFLFSKILKLEPTNEPYHYGWVGTIVHNSVYYSIANFIDKTWVPEKVKDLEEVKKFFIDAWEGNLELPSTKALAEEGEIVTKKPLFKQGSETSSKYVKAAATEEGRWKLLAWDLVKIGYMVFADTVPKLVEDIKKDVVLEHELRFDFDQYDVVGYVDALLNVKGHKVFFDLKTTKRPPKSVDEDIQFYLYRYGLKKTFGLSYFPVGYYVHLRSAKLYPTKTSELEDMEKTHESIVSIIRAIEARHFPASLGSPLCSFCEYRSKCYGTSSEKTLLSGEETQKFLEEIPSHGKVVLFEHGQN